MLEDFAMASPFFSVQYPIFLILLILFCAKLEYDETAIRPFLDDPSSIERYLHAQEKLQKKCQRREKIRQLKRKAEKQLDKQKEKK